MDLNSKQCIGSYTRHFRSLVISGLQAQLEQESISTSLWFSPLCLFPCIAFIHRQRVSSKPHMCTTQARGKVYVPEFLVDAARCALMELACGTWFSLKESLNRKVGFAKKSSFHGAHQLLRNLRDSQWNLRPVGKREGDSQQVSTMWLSLLFSSLRHPGEWAWAVYKGERWPSAVFSVPRPSREVYEKSHTGDLSIVIF